MHSLIEHIIKITSCSEIDEHQVLSFFDIRLCKKKEVLQEEHKPCIYYYFVIKGCLRMFFTDHNGSEQTLQFALENWWMTDLDAFRERKRSAYSIQALEAAEVMAISAAHYALMLKEVPLMEQYFRRIYERAYAASLFRIRLLSRMPKQEFYESFASGYPEFVQRIPQKILASFLGFTPEYLSELRKNKMNQSSAKKKRE